MRISTLGLIVRVTPAVLAPCITISTGARAQDVDRVLLLREPAHHQHSNPGVTGLYVPQDIKAAAVRHVDVEQHEIPILFAQQVEGFVAARCLTHRIDAGVGLEELLESGADHRMIVRDQYS